MGSRPYIAQILTAGYRENKVIFKGYLLKRIRVDEFELRCNHPTSK
jgi:hypothetical protein